MTNLPEPLTPPECDVRSHDWFALKFRQVRDSEFWLNASDRVRVVSFHLWGCAYEQVPAASLPDRDDRLADLAGYGMFGIEQWRSIRDDVLKAWVKCSDGRWYHPTLAEIALEAWISKLRERARKTGQAGERAASQLPVATAYLERLLKRRGNSPEAVENSTEEEEHSAETRRSSAEKSRSSGVTRQEKTGEERDSPVGESRSLALFDDRSNEGKPTWLDPSFDPPSGWLDEAMTKGRLSPEETALEWDGFKAYWLEQAGKTKGKKRDWKRTWINYVTSDICQKRVGARRRNNPSPGGSDGRPHSLVARTAERYR